MRLTSVFVLFAILFFAPLSFAQGSANATCNFDDQSQLDLQYQRVTINLKKPLAMQIPFGKAWAPGGKPMTLFTNVAIEIHARMLPIGAYTLFVLPTSKQWTLIVSKSTDTSGAYNEADDLVRVPMDSGELPNPEAYMDVGLEHAGPNQCNIRIDLDKYGHFATFKKQ